MRSVFACAVQDLLSAGGGDRHRCVPQPPRGEGRALQRLVLLPRRPHGVEGMRFLLLLLHLFQFLLSLIWFLILQEELSCPKSCLLILFCALYCVI